MSITDLFIWELPPLPSPLPPPPTPGTINKTSLNKWSHFWFTAPKLLLAANELIVVLGYSIKGKSVILLVNINYLQLRVNLSHCKELHDNTDWQAVNMVIALSFNCLYCKLLVYEYQQILSSQYYHQLLFLFQCLSTFICKTKLIWSNK